MFVTSLIGSNHALNEHEEITGNHFMSGFVRVYTISLVLAICQLPELGGVGAQTGAMEKVKIRDAPSFTNSLQGLAVLAHGAIVGGLITNPRGGGYNA
jgi:hypothetical protein